MDLAEASSILWRQRQLLELLLFRLDVEQALLATGRGRWLARATDDVERVLDELRMAELARSIAIDDVGARLGLPSGCSLRDLAEAAPAPYDTILTDHRNAFLELTAEVDLVAKANRELIRRTQQAAGEVLGAAPATDPFDGSGGATTRPTSVLVDQVI